MRMTLLEIVQSVLSSMDSDSVNDINDTVESEQVASVAREVYYELMTYNDWDHLYEWRQLEGVSDTSRPNFLKIPDSVGRVEIFKYDVTDNQDPKRVINELTYLTPNEFIRKVHSRSSSESNVEVVTNSNNVDMFIEDDKEPEFWTSFDNEYIVTDSYDKTVDTTLQESKSSAWCRVVPSWTQDNDFTPDLPTEFFPPYLAEVKSTCHLYFKQQASQKDEQKARRGLSHVRRKERFGDRGSNWVGYGRK